MGTGCQPQIDRRIVLSELLVLSKAGQNRGGALLTAGQGSLAGGVGLLVAVENGATPAKEPCSVFRGASPEPDVNGDCKFVDNDGRV